MRSPGDCGGGVGAEVGLPITIGVARTKFLAKIASGVAKPDGLLVVGAGHEPEFLRPLPVGRLWGVGPATSVKLKASGIHTVGQIADAAQANLVAILGSATGQHLHALANNLDPRPVRSRGRRRSIGSQCALGRPKRSPQELDVALLGLVDRVARRMRKQGVAGRTLTLRLRYGDYSRSTRSRTLAHPTAETRTLLGVGRALLGAELGTIRRRGLTLIGVTVANLGSEGSLQLSLPLEGHTPAALDRAVDEVRDRFGPTALRPASVAERGPHLQPWLMPGEELER